MILFLFNAKLSILCYTNKVLEENMYKIGETVIHSNHGVCKITNIEKLSFDGIESEYYVLEPVYANRNSIVLKIPVNNNDYLDKMISKNALSTILNDVCKSKDSWNDNPIKRNLEFKSLFANKDYVNLGILVRTIYNRKMLSKKLSATDKKIFESAKFLMFGIIASVQNMDYEDVEEYFYKKVI